MRTYTFFYFDSDFDYKDISYKKYTVSAYRFDFAFYCFVRFLQFYKANYINFACYYNVFNGTKTQVRFLSDDDCEFLTRVVNNYGAALRVCDEN